MHYFVFVIALSLTSVALAQSSDGPSSCLSRPLLSLKPGSQAKVPSYLPHFERFQKQIETAHVLPTDLSEIVSVFGDKNLEPRARMLAEKLQKIAEGKAYYTKTMDRDGLEALSKVGISKRTWDLLKGHSQTREMTFFGDAEKLAHIQSLVPGKCAAGECRLVQAMNANGYATFEVTHEDTVFRMLTCVKTSITGCKSLGETRDIYPICGSGVKQFRPQKFLKYIQRAASGASTVEYKYAAEALGDMPCSL